MLWTPLFICEDIQITTGTDCLVQCCRNSLIKAITLLNRRQCWRLMCQAGQSHLTWQWASLAQGWIYRSNKRDVSRWSICIVPFCQSKYHCFWLAGWLCNAHDCTLYMTVHCTWLYNVHDCTMYMIVHCTWLYIEHDCTLYMIVQCTWLYIVHDCTLYMIVHCT